MPQRGHYPINERKEKINDTMITDHLPSYRDCRKHWAGNWNILGPWSNKVCSSPLKYPTFWMWPSDAWWFLLQTFELQEQPGNITHHETTSLISSFFSLSIYQSIYLLAVVMFLLYSKTPFSVPNMTLHPVEESLVLSVLVLQIT